MAAPSSTSASVGHVRLAPDPCARARWFVRPRAAWPNGRAGSRLTSAASGVTGRAVRVRKVGGDRCNGSGPMAGARSRDAAASKRGTSSRCGLPANETRPRQAGRRPAACARRPRRPRCQLAELVIDEHAQRLERARRGMNLAGFRAHHAAPTISASCRRGCDRQPFRAPSQSHARRRARDAPRRAWRS